MKRVAIVIVTLMVLVGGGLISEKIWMNSKTLEVQMASSLAEDNTQVKEKKEMKEEKEEATEIAGNDDSNVCDVLLQKPIVGYQPAEKSLDALNISVSKTDMDNSESSSGIDETTNRISNVTTEDLNNTTKPQNVSETESTKECSYKFTYNKLYVSYDGGSQWKVVPTKMEELFNRGDDLIHLLDHYYEDPSIFNLEQESYYITPQKTVFVFGGSSKIPLSIISSNDSGNTWTRTVVEQNSDINSEFGVRRAFVTFPGNGDCGYLVATGSRTMHEEVSLIYKTMDGGATWSANTITYGDMLLHALTISAAFSTDQIGFITMGGSQDTSVWYTIDGGFTWNPLTFDEKPESAYTIDFAFIKGFDGNKGTLYVGTKDMEQPEYYKYVSDDYGITWKLVGIENTDRYLSELQEYGI